MGKKGGTTKGGTTEASLLVFQEFSAYFEMAERTGLEPATPGVTGRYSNQLNYRSTVEKFSKYLVGGDGIEPPTLCL